MALGVTWTACPWQEGRATRGFVSSPSLGLILPIHVRRGLSPALRASRGSECPPRGLAANQQVHSLPRLLTGPVGQGPSLL